MESFEEMVSDLDDVQYAEVEVKLAVDASIVTGFLKHEDCDCDNQVVVISFKQRNGDDVNVAILPGTPLWDALVDGRFHAKFQERVSQTS